MIRCDHKDWKEGRGPHADPGIKKEEYDEGGTIMSRRRICKALAACLVLATLLSAFPAMAAGTEAADSVYRN